MTCNTNYSQIFQKDGARVNLNVAWIGSPGGMIL